jgi:FkbM family methyltransferase
MTDASPLLDISVHSSTAGKQLQRLLSELRLAPYDKDDLRQFMAFAMGLARKSKAQLFQDLWALWACDQKLGGYFVEIGAADGVHLSNSYFLEKEMAWQGLLAEPNPRFFESLSANRSCAISNRCVHSETGRSVEFIAARTGEYSRVAEIVPEDGHEAARMRGASKIIVETITLDDLLVERGAPHTIDYLSIDTEGAELEILGAFDFGRWDVRTITVEHNYSPAREGLHELLTGKGYRRPWPKFTRWDDWYVREG